MENNYQNNCVIQIQQPKDTEITKSRTLRLIDVTSKKTPKET